MSRHRINLNEMDVVIAEREGGEVNLPIGQIKEVRRLTLEYLAAVIVADGIDGTIEVLSLLRRVASHEDESDIEADSDR